MIDSIDDDTMMSLRDAALRMFPSGEITADSLKRQARAGKLRVYRIGKSYSTTIRDVKAMIELCAVPVKFVHKIPRIDQREWEQPIPCEFSATELALAALNLPPPKRPKNGAGHDGDRLRAAMKSLREARAIAKKQKGELARSEDDDG